MNPSTAQARVMVEALIHGGVTDAVLAPGSRSAPLALALAAAERQRRLRLHVRIDERSAGFLALGLAKAAGRPVPVVTTSGTAVANLLPAVVEASFAGVPLVVLSADRPPWLRGVGAPQTIDQIKIFGDHVRWYTDVAVAGGARSQVGDWRAVVGRALVRAVDGADPGPVHLNLPFAEPLVPGEDPDVDSADVRGDGVVGVPLHPSAPQLGEVLQQMGIAEIPQRGLIVVGDLPFGWGGADVAELAMACDWPILAEPTGGLHDAANWVPSGHLVAASTEWLQSHRPELVLTVGRIGLTREVSALVRRAERHLAVDRSARWGDPTRTADGVVAAVPVATRRPGGSGDWCEEWLAAGQRASEQVDAALDQEDMLTGLHVARHLWRSGSDDTQLFAAASWPIRQVQFVQRPRGGLHVTANRGANGIDGLVSTAWGAAVSHAAERGGPTVALLGDLAFLHDSNGLLAPSPEDRPPLRYVVTDNDGGGIFSQLEQAAPAYAADFERVFGTPHGLHLVGRSRLCGIPARGVDDLDSFVEACEDPPPGVSVLVAQVADRASEAQFMGEIQRRAVAAVAGA